MHLNALRKEPFQLRCRGYVKSSINWIREKKQYCLLNPVGLSDAYGKLDFAFSILSFTDTARRKDCDCQCLDIVDHFKLT